jgi:hypothetical protein
MSALCQKQTSAYLLFDHLVGPNEQHSEAKSLGRFEVDRQQHLRRELDRQIARSSAVPVDAYEKAARTTKQASCSSTDRGGGKRRAAGV